MTNEEATNILEHEKREFLDHFIDYGGVVEAYDMGIDALKRQIPVKSKIGYDRLLCGYCEKTIHYNALWCPWCGRKIKQ